MQKYCSPTGDAESPSVRNFIANHREESFCVLNKKNDPVKKNKYRKLFFSRAVCHLSFKISVAFKI